MLSAPYGPRLRLAQIAYAVRMAVRFRSSLAHYLRTTPAERRPWQISVQELRAGGAKILALDFDGVLAPHGQPRPCARMLAWLDQCLEEFGAENVFVLSNAPSPARMAFFHQRFQNVRWVTNCRPKPYPDGLERVLSLTRKAPCELLLIDDRLLTGGLSACIAQVKLCYVRRPIVDLSQSTTKELFFMTLRWMERLMLRPF